MATEGDPDFHFVQLPASLRSLVLLGCRLEPDLSSLGHLTLLVTDGEFENAKPLRLPPALQNLVLRRGVFAIDADAAEGVAVWCLNPVRTRVHFTGEREFTVGTVGPDVLSNNGMSWHEPPPCCRLLSEALKYEYKYF